jgi:hypothetical protein
MSPEVQHVTCASPEQCCNLTPEVRYVNEQSSIIHISATYYYQTYQTPTPSVHVCMFTSVFDMRRMFTKLSVICAACSLERLLCAAYLPMHVLFVLHFSKGLFAFCACPTTEGVCCKFETYAIKHRILVRGSVTNIACSPKLYILLFYVHTCMFTEACASSPKYYLMQSAHISRTLLMGHTIRKRCLVT